MTNTMNRNDINTAARNVIITRGYDDLTPTRSQIVKAVEAYCDDPAITRGDRLRIITRIEIELGMLD